MRPDGDDADTGVDDFALLAAWRSGDEAAANVLIARHYRGVHAFFSRRIPEVDDDLTQRTFLACVEALASFRAEASFRGFLFGIARNTLLKHLRGQARFQAMRDRGFDDDAMTRTTPSGMVGKRQEQRLLLSAFAQLPGDLQMTVELFYWQGLRTSEIGDALDIPVSTVTTRLQRARELLRRHVAEIDGPEPPRAALLADLEGWTRSIA